MLHARLPQCRAILVLALVVLTVASGGCRRRTTAASPPPPEPVGQSTIVLPAGARPTGAVPPSPPALAAQLNDALHSFLQMKGRLPHELSELAQEKLVPTVPPAPPGRKYVIDGNKLEVLLINQ